MLQQTKVFTEVKSGGSSRMYLVGGVIFFVLVMLMMNGSGGSSGSVYSHSIEEAKKMRPMTFSECLKATGRKNTGDFHDGGSALLYEDKGLGKDSKVFIVGGRNGDLAYVLADRYGSRVFVFEGIKARYEELKRRFQSMSNVIVYPYYLSGADTTPISVPVTADEARASKSKRTGRSLLMSSATASSGASSGASSWSGSGASGSGAGASSGASASAEASAGASGGSSGWSSGASSGASGSATATTGGAATTGGKTVLMEEVERRTLRGEVQKSNVHKIALLHLDCEGCEQDVLTYLTERPNQVQEIQFAFSTDKHVDEPVSTYCHIQEALASKFKLLFRYPYVFESWKRLG